MISKTTSTILSNISVNMKFEVLYCYVPLDVFTTTSRGSLIMKRDHLIKLLLLCLLLLTFEAACQRISQNLIPQTTETDKQESEENAYISKPFNYSFETNMKVKTINQKSNITREFKQRRRHTLTVKEGSGFILQEAKGKFVTNAAGLIDYGNENTDDATLYEDEAIRSKSRETKSRLDGFSMTDPEDNPYAVMLVEFLEDHEYFGICSGSLVTLEWVLTAASHCFSLMEVDEIEIHAGGYSKKEWSEHSFRSGHQMIRSVEFYIHPSYKERPDFVDYYDVALVKAERKFKSTSKVSVVEISAESRRPRKMYKTCKATGFGKVQYFEKHPDFDFVRKTHTLEIKSPCPCLENEKNPETWLCARPTENVGICGSDWGAGLICSKKLTAVATEVIAVDNFQSCNREDKSYCARNNSLSVFQNVYPCLDWIKGYIDSPPKRDNGTRSKPDNKKNKGVQNSSIFSLIVSSVGITLTQS